MKVAQCPSADKWIKQLCDIYTVEYYLAVKKKILPFATVWMDLENIRLNEISQRMTIPNDFTHMWNLVNKLN